MVEIGGGCAANVHRVHNTAGIVAFKADLRLLFGTITCRATVVTPTNYNDPEPHMLSAPVNRLTLCFRRLFVWGLRGDVWSPSSTDGQQGDVAGTAFQHCDIINAGCRPVVRDVRGGGGGGGVLTTGGASGTHIFRPAEFVP